MSEREKFLSWYQQEQNNGLIRFNVNACNIEDVIDESMSEEYFGELNRMVNSPNLRCDSDVPL